MSYALITALIFTLVAIMHGWRIYNRWTVQIGPHSISIMSRGLALSLLPC